MKQTGLCYCSIVLAVLLLITESPCFGQPPGGFGRGRRRGPPSPVMQAIDQDGNEALSAQEIASATKSILSLDRNGDGNIVTSEMAVERGRRRRGGPPGMGPPDPMLSALDKDSDGELFEDEVTDAAISLLKLDKNGDGSIGADELRPQREGSPFGRRGFGRRPRGNREGAPPKPTDLKPEDGAATVNTLDDFRTLAYQGKEVLIDTHLAGLQFIKFQIEDAGGDEERIYFINTKTHRAHMMFSSAVGLQVGFGRGNEGQMRGVMIYWPMISNENGSQGLFTYEFEPNDAFSFEMVHIAYGLLQKFAPVVKDRLAYNILPYTKTRVLDEIDLYLDADLPLFETSQQYSKIGFLPLHEGTGVGRLRLMTGKDRPTSRDIVLYPTLPNEMPRVAGIITEVRQTPLSHVNLRAIQDDVPNAYLKGASKNPQIAPLIGKYVHYTVNADGFSIRAASSEEVNQHSEAIRPKEPQSPGRDLSETEIKPLSELGFASSISYGVKAANVAELMRVGLPGGTTPKGYAIPFAFYHQYMEHNSFYEMAKSMIATEDFKSDDKTRRKALKKFRKAIKKGTMPENLREALAKVQKAFPNGTSIRCRSSTNNEDLPGFSGAGLYSSYTHRLDEGHLEKSIKQVFASLWNLRAFEERNFYRIDHLKTAMGVLLHPNTSDERANGVAVTQDVLYQSESQFGPRFYINAQVGEDLITNPDANSTPEELLISPRNPRTDRVIQRSNKTKSKAPVISADHLLELRRALRKIETHFRNLYKPDPKAAFAMEIEFKITKANRLFIKQARPWVF